MLLISDPLNSLHLAEKPLSPPLQSPSDITWEVFTNKNKGTTQSPTTPLQPPPNIDNFEPNLPLLHFKLQPDLQTNL